MVLRERITDEALDRKLNGVEDYVKKEILRFWHVHAPHFTDHGISHSENIISILDRMIPPDVADKIDEYEAFLLVCGAWLHDIGMLVRKAGEKPEQVRATHHERGRELIRKGLSHIDLTEEERFVIGEIAFYHREIEDLGKAKEIYEIQHDSKASRVRVRFLCALLRLADGCEIAHARSSQELVEIAGIDDEARFYHEGHLHVASVGFDPIAHKITIYIRAKNQGDADLLTKFLTSALEKELASVKAILGEQGVDYDSVKCDLTFDSFAQEMSLPQAKVKELSLEDKLAELEKRGGYYPNMVIEEGSRVEIFYETIALTRKELQREILALLKEIWLLFSRRKRFSWQSIEFMIPKELTEEQTLRLLPWFQNEGFRKIQEERNRRKRVLEQTNFPEESGH